MGLFSRGRKEKTLEDFEREEEELRLLREKREELREQRSSLEEKRKAREELMKERRALARERVVGNPVVRGTGAVLGGVGRGAGAVLGGLGEAADVLVGPGQQSSMRGKSPRRRKKGKRGGVSRRGRVRASARTDFFGGEIGVSSVNDNFSDSLSGSFGMGKRKKKKKSGVGRLQTDFRRL